MIHKFERLVSVGKFRNYQAAGPVNFHRLTVIYADNGSGKTTLANVLRSLRDQNPDIIHRRRSTGITTPQAVQIIQRTSTGDVNHTFRATGWSNPLAEIEIFDIHFINENIYSGFEFKEDHKRGLHEFVIGAQGVALKQQIEENKRQKVLSRQNQERTTTEIITQVGAGLTNADITTFLGLAPENAQDIDEHIKRAEAALMSARANAIIQTLTPLDTIRPFATIIDFPSLIADLSATTETIQDVALKSIFESQIDDLQSHGVTSANGWLRHGYNYVLQKHVEGAGPCPFCKQEVNSDSDLLKAYTIQFNAEFNALIERLKGYANQLSAVNGEAVKQQLQAGVTSNGKRILSWAQYVTTVAKPVIEAVPESADLSVLLKSAIETVNEKITNPIHSVATTAVDALQSGIVIFNEIISRYNATVNEYNEAIARFKAGIISEDTALRELNRLRRIKMRFEPTIQTLVAMLNTERQNLRVLEQSYTTLVQQEQTAAVAFFTQYKDRINHYLRSVFRTPFQIDNVSHIAPQGRATQSKLGYKLTIHGQEISFDPGQEVNVKDCLSEGDKSTLALAFFLSKLDIDRGNADKVVVFDDPLSSLDAHRRNNTVKLIKELVYKVKQVIVLSHNEFFLAEIYKGITPADKKALRIAEDFTTDSSRIETVDLEKLVEHEYFRDVTELQDFLSSADILKKDHILGLMRNVLEAHIRFKFYRQTAGIPEGRRTFGNLIAELDTRTVAFRDTNRASVISKLRVINDISWRSHHGDPAPDYASLGVNPATMPVRELAGFVSDTLDLIDNRL